MKFSKNRVKTDSSGKALELYLSREEWQKETDHMHCHIIIDMKYFPITAYAYIRNKAKNHIIKITLLQ